MLEKIFEPYFTTKAKGDGTGLGLAIVQSIVFSCGGDIIVRSELGKGSAFQVYLPVIRSEEEKQQEEETAPPPSGKERVLIVDDDAGVAGTNSSILKSLGYQVTALHSSAKALALFSSQPEYFDLLLTDMTMPEMTGAELMRKILALRPDLPVLLCTGFSELIDEQKAVEQGAYCLLMKPFSKQELARTVRAALNASALATLI
jgi:CheY-like chemotaxis protein